MTFEPERMGQSSRELADQLRELRKRSGLSGARVAARCNMSQSKVSRIENGKVRPSLVDVEQILRAIDAPAELVAEVSALARMANTDWQDARSLRRKGLDKKQFELAGLEAASTEFRYFLLSMITGLLSTPAYIRASLAHIPSWYCAIRGTYALIFRSLPCTRIWPSSGMAPGSTSPRGPQPAVVDL